MKYKDLIIGIPREIMNGESRVAAIPETVKKLKQGNRPLLVTIPDGDGNGRNRDSITEYIRDAIGIKI